MNTDSGKLNTTDKFRAMIMKTCQVGHEELGLSMPTVIEVLAGVIAVEGLGLQYQRGELTEWE